MFSVERVKRIHTLKFLFTFMHGRKPGSIGLADLEEDLLCRHKKLLISWIQTAAK